MKYAYPAIVTRAGGDSSRCRVAFPDFSALSAEGINRRQALAAACDCLAGTLMERVRLRQAIPPPGRRGGVLLAPPVLIAAKLALYREMRAQGISNMALAERMRTVEGTVRRLLDVDHRSHIGQVERALQLLGKRVIADVRNAG